MPRRRPGQVKTTTAKLGRDTTLMLRDVLPHEPLDAAIWELARRCAGKNGIPHDRTVYQTRARKNGIPNGDAR